jgi:hypothetical protein
MVSKVDQQTVDFQNFHPTTVDFSKKVSQQSIYAQKSTVDFKAWCAVVRSMQSLVY